MRQYLQDADAYQSAKQSNPQAPQLAGALNSLKDKAAKLERLISRNYDGHEQLFEYLEGASANELQFDLRAYQREIDSLPATLNLDASLVRPVSSWRKFLETVMEDVREALAGKGGQISPAQKLASQTAQQVHVYLETVRLLEQQCEDAVKKCPNHEAEIRRRYRKAIDALKDIP
jgi:chromosome segregation ATPase